MRLKDKQIDKIFKLRNSIDRLAKELIDRNKELKEEYINYQEGDGDYSIAGLLYAASSDLDMILERENK